MNRIERLSQFSVILIGIVVLLTALDQAQNILAPMTLALVAGIVLSPISDFWAKIGFAPVVGALTSLLLTLVALSLLSVVLQPVVARLVDQAPKVWYDMQDVIHMFRDFAAGVADVTNGMAEAVAPEAQATGTAPAAAAEASVAMPTVTDALMLAPTILAQILVFAGTLFFFLLTRNDIYRWSAHRLAPPDQRADLTMRLKRAERQVSRYFMTITAINAALGLATAVALKTLGLPGALLWGAVAFALNFVLYLGPAVLAVSLLFAGIAAFDGPMALLPALIYVALNTTEGQFVTPALVGRQLQLNPLLVFLSLVLGLWLWGPIGGVVAIPLLLWILVLSDNLPEHLSERTRRERERAAQ